MWWCSFGGGRARATQAVADTRCADAGRPHNLSRRTLDSLHRGTAKRVPEEAPWPCERSTFGAGSKLASMTDGEVAARILRHLPAPGSYPTVQLTSALSRCGWAPSVACVRPRATSHEPRARGCEDETNSDGAPTPANVTESSLATARQTVSRAPSGGTNGRPRLETPPPKSRNSQRHVQTHEASRIPINVTTKAEHAHD